MVGCDPLKIVILVRIQVPQLRNVGDEVLSAPARSAEKREKEEKRCQEPFLSL